jgi:SH3-like domain-containing protein
MDGAIVTVAEQGMSLDVIEDNGRWSKVRVFDKTGWISNKLIKTEVQMQD